MEAANIVIPTRRCRLRYFRVTLSTFESPWIKEQMPQLVYLPKRTRPTHEWILDQPLVTRGAGAATGYLPTGLLPTGYVPKGYLPTGAATG